VLKAGSSSQKYVGGLGHESEGNTSLIYMRARYMDPVLGRFVGAIISFSIALGTDFSLKLLSSPTLDGLLGLVAAATSVKPGQNGNGEVE